MPLKKAEVQFPLVQALRALAAAAVAVTHTLYDALGMAPGNGAVQQLYGAMPWGAGVDIFFVISGFVIAHSSRKLFGTPNASGRFLGRRLARIVPLYWLMTSLLLIETALAPGTINGAIGGAAYIVQSYLFIPCPRPDGLVQPVLGLGWTLNYEMFFYAVFASFLWLRRQQAIATICLLLAGFVALGHLRLLHGVILQTWSDPIVLEFCAGMLIATLPGRLTLHASLRLCLSVAALALLHLNPAWPRILAYGIPAAALVIAAVTGKSPARLPRLEAWLVLLGDASYALYLAHPFAMRAVALLWQHLHQPGGITAYIVISLVLAQIAALALHQAFEKPLLQYIRKGRSSFSEEG